MTPTPVRAWVDHSCPWAWQTVRWLLDLRAREIVELSWSLFSLEVNSSPRGIPFREAAPRHGPSLAALTLARAEGGRPAFEALYLALGSLLHDAAEEPSAELLRKAAAEADLIDIADRAIARLDELGTSVIAEYLEARRHDVFGVPTLGIGGHKVVYGPIVASAPADDALELWHDVRRFAERDDLFELKRWPRDRRPGEGPPSS